MNNYSHACPDWDFLKIDKDDPEFGWCNCFSEDPKSQSIKNLINEEYFLYLEQNGWSKNKDNNF